MTAAGRRRYAGDVMEHAAAGTEAPVRFETHPSRYVHWRLEIEPPRGPAGHGRRRRTAACAPVIRSSSTATTWAWTSSWPTPSSGCASSIRRCACWSSPAARTACSARAPTSTCWARSTHAFKVNFCKYTNETRLRHGGRLRALGPQVPGRRQRRLRRAAATSWRWPATRSCWWTTPPRRSACPRCSLLAVLPGTGGLTRVVDKRKVRRDLADVFSSLGEGVKGKRAVQWRLVDETVPLSRFAARVPEKARGAGRRRPGAQRARRGAEAAGSGRTAAAGIEHRYVTLKVDAEARVARLTVRGPEAGRAGDGGGHARAGQRAVGAARLPRAGRRRCSTCASTARRSAWWCCETRGEVERVLAADRALCREPRGLVRVPRSSST